MLGLFLLPQVSILEADFRGLMVYAIATEQRKVNVMNKDKDYKWTPSYVSELHRLL
ncbi:hypothetical protein [Candidatus Magnetominusculus dajiuhuensis]|uniref:hypothetical protein n=1 Tax=Candidatus Magnetominusculus dajiuhuensis TaxID=3137712 RepID=UPI003B427F36